MKIAILGPLSFTSEKELSIYVELNKKNLKKGFHPHPWILNLALGLKNIPGNEVHIITTSLLVNKNSTFKYEGINFHILKSKTSILNYLTFFLPEIVRLMQVLKKVKPDIVHGQHRSFHSLAAIIYSRKHVITDHGNLFTHIQAQYKTTHLKRFFKLSYYKLIYFSTFQLITTFLAKQIIGVSQNCLDISRYKNKYSLIYNPINKSFFQFRWEKPEVPVILFVGTSTNRKRPHLLIQYLKKNEDVIIHLVTQLTINDQYNKEVIKFIEDNNLTKRVKISPFMDPNDLAKIMAESSILCLPSAYESFGMVLAEAMAVGCPVVGSNIGGIPEVITNKETGLLFNTNDIEDLYSCFNKILNDEKLAFKLSENGKKDALKRFHPNSVAKETLILYKKILKS